MRNVSQDSGTRNKRNNSFVARNVSWRLSVRRYREIAIITAESKRTQMQKHRKVLQWTT